ncbi:major facilitator superfamily nitrite extrusion protein [Salmonella enterica subsp. arizonae]|uniref:Major facilitator superfamily nitrite extrusion protein n=1 Tax=Salmonella enterica subsp. arizonae TaxID=59203 RepID=A0A2X4WJQ5_SALER|nr:major facilitator superfamily nitrite extrusion protein [Salmonella enterica subsp. arizonae]
MIYINLPSAVNPNVADIKPRIRGVYESLICPERATGAVITEWRPEDPAFWQQRGHRVASRNLWISVPCLLLAFCVWMLFSAVAVNLPKVGFNFTTDQLFMLTALPSVSGALLRVPYSFMVPLFGGRRWTAFSTGILIVPCVWLGFAVSGYQYAL